jgi:hypothetical protein
MLNTQEVLSMQSASIGAMQQQAGFAQQMGNVYGYAYQGHNLPGQGFSYGRGSETGYGFSNQMGMGAVGAAPMAFKAAAVGMAGMGAMAGYKAGGFGGAIRGGIMAGGLGAGAALTVGAYAGGQMYEGAAEQNSMYQMLGQNFQFSNSGSRTGRGFSRQDARGISEFARELQSLPELMTSFGEIQKIMEKTAQAGIMNGARNAQEFQRRFKETLTTLKEVSKVMETSLEGAMQYFQEARQSGLYNPQMIRMNAAQRQFTAGVTGMNQNQIGQLQQFGSQVSFATGGFRGSGAQSALRSARQIGMMNEMGLLSNDRIAELTGMEGAAGIQAMAGGLTEASHRMAQGSLGTAMSIALGKQDKSGRFTGAIDEELAEKVRMGGISKEQLLSMAHKKTASQVSKISFKSQENKLRSEMASRVGVEGMGMELQDILGGAGWQNPDAVNLVMQRYGLDERTAKMVQELGNNLPTIQRELGSKAQTEGRRMAEQSYLKENLSMDAIKRKFLKKVENVVSEPLKSVGASMSNVVGEYVDNFMDGLMGRYSTNITRETSSLAGGALGGGKSSQVKLSEMLSGAGRIPMTPGVSSISMADRLLNSGTDFMSQDAKKAQFLEGLTGKGLANKAYSGIGMTAAIFGPTNYGQTNEQIAATKQYLGGLQSGSISDKAKAALSHKDTSNVKQAVANAIREYGHEMKDMSHSDRLKFIRNKIGSGMLSDLRSLERNGVSLEELVSHVQHTEGLTTHIGAVNFGKFSSEMYGTADFGGAKELSAAEKTAKEHLASAFGHQSAQVTALLGTDSKSRDLFLKAAGGDKEAQSLLTQNLSVADREKLLKKYGINEGQLDQLQGMYGGAKGKDVSGLAKNMQVALNRSSLGGLAAQLRRQGLDIKERWKGSGMSLGSDASQAIISFTDRMSGLTDKDSMASFLGGEGASQIDKLLNAVSGLKGDARKEALGVLGEGASSAIGFGEYVTRQAGRKGGLSVLKDKLPAELLEEFTGKMKPGGTLSDKDAADLGRRARNQAFGGSLANSGNVVAKEVQAQKDLTENLNRFAQTTSQFAELVIQATPQLGENVRKARENMANASSNITNQNQSVPGQQ